MDYLKEDGSLDIERISRLSVGKFIEVFPELTPEQQDEYISQLPESDGPVEPVVIDERFDAGMEERHLEYARHRETEKAAQIASWYLENHPRPEYFLTSLCSSSEDSEGAYYRKLDESEKDLVRKWEEGRRCMTLDRFIKSEDRELYDHLVCNRSLYALDMIRSCDLKDMKKFSACKIRQYEKDTDSYRTYDSIFPLSDEEFIELLTDRIAIYRDLTMNSVVVHHPELAQKIMRHLICLTGMEGENFHPFLVTFTEIDDAFEDIARHQEDLSPELRIYFGFQKIIGL